MITLLREISFRHWQRSKLRSLLVVLGIALGVALYVATAAANDSLLATYADLVERIAGRAQLSVQGSSLGVPVDLVTQVAEVPGVAHAAAACDISAQAPDFNESLLVLGLDLLGDLHFLPFHVQSGEQRAIADPLSFVNDPSALLLSRRFAQRHGLTTGSELKLLTPTGPRQFHVRGLLDESGVTASFGGQVAVMFLDAAQLSFGRGNYADRIDVALAPGAALERTRAAIRARLGKEYTVERPEQVGGRLRALAAPLQMGLMITGLLAITVGAFLVYNAVGVAVAQRRHEVGTLRALGQTRGGIVGLFMIESALLSVPGSALGLLLGHALARYSVAMTLDTLDAIFVATSQQVPALKPDVIVRAFVAGTIMSMISAYLPARRGTAFDPAVVLRGTAATAIREPPLRLMALIAIALFGLAQVPMFEGTAAGGFMQLLLILAGSVMAAPSFVVGMRALLVPGVEAALGVPGRLGLDYVERTLGRSTVNVLALMVAVGMSFSVSSWLGSFESSLARWASDIGTSDLTVTRGSPLLDRRHLPLAADAAERVAATGGVRNVQRFRMLDELIGDVKVRLMATDLDVFMSECGRRGKGWEVLDGPPLRAADRSGEPSLILSENAAHLLHIRAGDSVNIATPTQGEIAFKVRAVVVDYTSETGAAFIDLKLFHRFWIDDTVDGLLVYVDASYNTDDVASAIRVGLAGSDADGDGGIFVTKSKKVMQQILDTLGHAFTYSGAVEMMTLIIGLLGVIGTMIAAVIDRQPELSLLRAVGATRTQVAAAIVVEAGFLGFCAAAAGILVGMIETQVFFRTLVAAATGWHLQFVFPWSDALRTTGLVVVTTALAGLVPAYRAVQGEVIGAAPSE